jgi:hypothetical protein
VDQEVHATHELFALQLALKEHDERQLYLARRNLFDMRNVYAVTTDVLHKNIAKARDPASPFVIKPSSPALLDSGTKGQ